MKWGRNCFNTKMHTVWANSELYNPFNIIVFFSENKQIDPFTYLLTIYNIMFGYVLWNEIDINKNEYE